MKYFSIKVISFLTLTLTILISFQFYSFYNLYKFNLENLKDDINQAGLNFSNELSNEFNKDIEIDTKIKKEALKILKKEFKIDNTYRAKSIIEIYKIPEINEILYKYFNQQKLSKLQIDFAIGKEDGEIVACSKNYVQINNLNSDSSNTLSFYYIINNENQDNISTETIHIVVTKYKKFLLLWRMLDIIIYYIVITLFVFIAFVLILKNLVLEKKINISKDDFINYLSHEFKTPLASLKITSSNLNIKNITNNPHKLEIYRNAIKEEVNKLNDNINDLLEISNIKNIKNEFKKAPIKIIPLINKVVDGYKIQIEQKEVKLKIDHILGNYSIIGDEKYLYKLFSNLVDNAIKYSSKNPAIDIQTFVIQNKFYFKIKDNGIGMDKYTLKNIFNKFYRAHTGNIHNVKGFGIGMTFVKFILDAHKAKIKIESELGKGTSITLIFKIV